MASAALLGTVLAAAATAVYVAISRNGARLKRESYIRQFVFPASILQSLKKIYPQLEERDLYLVARALRQYFLVHSRSGNRTAGMPSRVVDALWHEFILDTKTYHNFCSKAFGKYFHHIPAGKVSSTNSRSEALRRTWHLACLEENIDPKKATRLPLLFAIDSKMKIPDGHVYDLEVIRKAPKADSGDACGGFGCSGGNCGADGCSGGCGGGCGGD
jgi:hypothetical protein